MRKTNIKNKKIIIKIGLLATFLVLMALFIVAINVGTGFVLIV